MGALQNSPSQSSRSECGDPQPRRIKSPALGIWHCKAEQLASQATWKLEAASPATKREGEADLTRRQVQTPRDLPAPGFSSRPDLDSEAPLNVPPLSMLGNIDFLKPK